MHKQASWWCISVPFSGQPNSNTNKVQVGYGERLEPEQLNSTTAGSISTHLPMT
jgi:hypothetical protein